MSNSGGFDSAVAVWRMMKRVEVDFIFCNLAGGAYERSVLAVVRALSELAHGTKPCLCGLTVKLSQTINEKCKPAYAQVVLKRAFYRTTSRVAKRAKCIGLITGEAVGQAFRKPRPILPL